jgi:hypothetical protein
VPAVAEENVPQDQDRTTRATEPDLLDDPLAALETFVAYIRDSASRTEVLMAAKWAALLVQAVDAGATRQRLGWPALPFPPSATVTAADVLRWARELERADGAGRLWLPA